MPPSKVAGSCSAVSMSASISPRLPSSNRLLFDRGAWKAHLVESAGRLPSRRPPVAAARRGGQGRRRLAPGPDPRAATRRPSWAEHGEHGEDPPLDRSEHRGTHPSQPPVPVVHASLATNYRKLSDSNYRLVLGSARGFSLGSARGFRWEVPVDNSLIHRSAAELLTTSDCVFQGADRTLMVRLATGRRAVPQGNSSPVLLDAGRLILTVHVPQGSPELGFKVAHAVMMPAELSFERGPRHECAFAPLNPMQALGQPRIHVQRHSRSGQRR